MTKLTYMVAGQEVTTYKEALNLAELYHTSITRRYTPVRKPAPKLTPLQEARRVKAKMA